MEDTEQGIGRTGRIGQRAEDVEDGAHAHLAAYRPDIFHCRMVIGCEHEAHAGAPDAFGYLRRLQVDLRAEGFQHIGGAGFRRHATVAVLGDGGASGRSDEGRRGGDIESVRTIAAGADDVDEMRIVWCFDLGAQFAHHRCGRSDFADGFLLDAQAGEDGGGHHRRNLAGHDQPHQVQHLVMEDFAMLDGAL